MGIGPQHVERLLAGGAEHDAIVKLLVASGAWTEDGAKEIVSTLAGDGAALTPRDEVAWPGPLEEVQPLFAT